MASSQSGSSSQRKSSSSSASESSSQPLPEWLREPGPGEIVVIAKTGEGAQLPEYVEAVLRKFEEELQAQQLEPGLEANCTVRINCTSLEIV